MRRAVTDCKRGQWRVHHGCTRGANTHARTHSRHVPERPRRTIFQCARSVLPFARNVETTGACDPRTRAIVDGFVVVADIKIVGSSCLASKPMLVKDGSRRRNSFYEPFTSCPKRECFSNTPWRR